MATRARVERQCALRPLIFAPSHDAPPETTRPCVIIFAASISCLLTVTASTNFRRACAQQPTCTSFGPPTRS
jgi:hypothetical protein